MFTIPVLRLIEPMTNQLAVVPFSRFTEDGRRVRHSWCSLSDLNSDGVTEPMTRLTGVDGAIAVAKESLALPFGGDVLVFGMLI